MVIMLVPLYGLYELGILLMVLAPARAVAEGRIWRFGKSPRMRRPNTTGDNRTAGASQSGEPAQTDALIPRPDPSSQPRGESSESEEAQ
jgi:hypothetical protein